MKAVIESVKFKREWESKFGKMYTHEVKYNGTTAQYNSKKKDQDKFKEGQEAEFTEEVKEGKYGPYTVIKPVAQGGQSNFHKQLKREQSKYSGFAMSYAKDLVVADKLEFDKILPAAEKMFNWMVQMDKTIQNND